MQMQILANTDITYLEARLLLPNKKLRLLPAAEYDTLDPHDLRLFCHKYARYGLPTEETVATIKAMIGGRMAIEIGCGHGDLGYHLGIHRTDAMLQDEPGIKELYRLTGQPTVNYPNDVKKLTAEAAVEKFKPQVVVGSWITEWISPHLPPPPQGGSVFGVKVAEMLAKIETYIMVGNLATHGRSACMSLPHDTMAFDFIRSRAVQPELDRIFTWERKCQ